MYVFCNSRFDCQSQQQRRQPTHAAGANPSHPYPSTCCTREILWHPSSSTQAPNCSGSRATVFCVWLVSLCMTRLRCKAVLKSWMKSSGHCSTLCCIFMYIILKWDVLDFLTKTDAPRRADYYATSNPCRNWLDTNVAR